MQRIVAILGTVSGEFFVAESRLQLVCLHNFNTRWRHEFELLVRYLDVLFHVPKAEFGKSTVQLFNGYPHDLARRRNLQTAFLYPILHTPWHAPKYHVTGCQGRVVGYQAKTVELLLQFRFS